MGRPMVPWTHGLYWAAGSEHLMVTGDYDRRTPLHLACASGNHGAVEAFDLWRAPKTIVIYMLR